MACGLLRDQYRLVRALGRELQREPDPGSRDRIGQVDAADFVDTIRTGRRMGRGRKVLPPMPISAYKNFNDEDLEAIFAYLQSVPAVQNRVPEPVAPGEHAAGTAN